MSNSDTALREFALIMANMRAEACFMGDYEINQLANQIESRLTAVISEHYYPKEDMIKLLIKYHKWLQKKKYMDIKHCHFECADEWCELNDFPTSGKR